LELHLSNDQIEKILRPGSIEESDSDRRIRHAAQSHLETCESCRAIVRTHEQVMQRLAFLKSATPMAPDRECPPEQVWFDLAAKTDLEDSEMYLRHATVCDHCGPLLRQAVGNLADELTSDEERLIASLTSTSPEWQTQMAARLCATELPAAKRTGRRYDLLLPLRPFVSPFRVAFAGAIVAFVVLAIRDHRKTEVFLTQSRKSEVEMQRLQQDILQQRTRLATLTAELANREVPLSHSPTQPTSDEQVTSLTLEAGLTRGTGEIPKLKMPLGAQFIKVTLHVTTLSGDVLREDLITVDRQKKFSQELRPSAADKRSQSLSLMVPAYLFTPDDYQIVLSRQSVDRFEEVGTYTFRVIR
jgi:hypothetical protein